MSTSSGQQNYGGMPTYNSGGTTQNPYSNAWGGPDLRAGSTNVNQNMQRTAQNLPGAPYWLQTQHAGYYGAPMSSNPMEYGRWNWAQGGAQGVAGQPGSTYQQPNMQPQQQPNAQPQAGGDFGPSPGSPSPAGPAWNGQANAPGDPWISGSGYGGTGGVAYAGSGRSDPAQPMKYAPDGSKDDGTIGTPSWWAAIKSAQGQG
jgi:hypothetical protein